MFRDWSIFEEEMEQESLEMSEPSSVLDKNSEVSKSSPEDTLQGPWKL